MTCLHFDVKYIASLARLSLSNDEVEAMDKHLSGIIGYISQLVEVDTGDAEPTSFPTASATPFRRDIPGQPLTKEIALSQAPDSSRGFFTVPKIVDDSNPSSGEDR